MGVLLRGTQENFNPQIHTEANSLTYLMNKHFEVRKKSLDLFARYTKFQSFMYASGRFNRGGLNGRVQRATASEDIKDNAYRIQYEGALILPAISYGAVQIGSIYDAGNSTPDMSGVAGVTYTNGITSATVATNTPGSIAIKHDPDVEIYGDKFNPNDSIVLDGGLGTLFVITGHPRRSADSSHYVLDGKFVGDVALFNEDHLDEDQVLTEGGDFFGEGSLRGWQRYNRNKWRINYTSIHRASMTMTGSAKQQKIAWVSNSETGAKFWEYDLVLKHDQLFHIKNELALRFARISMDPSTHSWFENYGQNKLTLNGFLPENGVAAPIIGDGWIPQIQDNFTVDYNPNTGITDGQISAMMTVLAQRSPSGSTGNLFVAMTDMLGAMVFDNAYKKLIGFFNPGTNTAAGAMSGNIVNIVTGKEVELGFQVTKYHYLGNTIYLVQDELFGNPGLFPTNGGITGKGNIYILNTSLADDGTPNFEMIARTGREFRRKYENGMHSWDESMDKSSIASSGFDGCSIHSLSEMMAVVYDMRSCGIFRATAAYAGGALSGNPKFANGAAEFMF